MSLSKNGTIMGLSKKTTDLRSVNRNKGKKDFKLYQENTGSS